MFRFRKFLRGDNGGTAVEFAFVMPLLLMISFALMEFAGLFFQYHRVNEATRVITRNLATSTPLVAQDTLIAANTHTCTADTCAGIADALSGTSSILPNLVSTDIEITYEVKDIGNVGYAEGYKPLITVKLVNLGYDFIMAGLIPGLPDTIALNPSESSMLGRWY